jgi:hypothetical protein
MAIKRKKARKRAVAFLVGKPATLKDYRRVYGITGGLLKEARKLEKEFSAVR